MLKVTIEWKGQRRYGFESSTISMINPSDSVLATEVWSIPPNQLQRTTIWLPWFNPIFRHALTPLHQGDGDGDGDGDGGCPPFLSSSQNRSWLKTRPLILSKSFHGELNSCFPSVAWLGLQRKEGSWFSLDGKSADSYKWVVITIITVIIIITIIIIVIFKQLAGPPVLSWLPLCLPSRWQPLVKEPIFFYLKVFQ